MKRFSQGEQRTPKNADNIYMRLAISWTVRCVAEDKFVLTQVFNAPAKNVLCAVIFAVAVFDLRRQYKWGVR